MPNRLMTTTSVSIAKHGGIVPRTHLALLCVLTLAATAWGWMLMDGQQGRQLDSFLLVLGVYGAVTAAFIAWRMQSADFRLFAIPTFLSLLAFVDFGLAPLACYLTYGEFNPGFHGRDGEFVRALAYVALGMMTFWAGAHIAERRGTKHQTAGFSTESVRAPSPPLGPAVMWALALYGVAFLVKTYFLENFGYDYATSLDVYFSHLAAMQVANVTFQLGTYALIILAIERSFHPHSLERKALFWLVFATECTWGLLSGMKSNLLQNFVLVGVVSSMADRKLKKGWLAAAVLGLVVVYPFSIQYRELVRTRAHEAMGVDDAGQILNLALDQAAGSESTLGGWVGTGAGSAISRLNLLQSVAALLSLGPRAQRLKGDERWWMLPFYPFVPRFLWRTKPILDKGRRFSVALGIGDQTSTALTYPGDLCFEFGLPGLLAGMFVFGLVAEGLTKFLATSGSKQHLFIYTGLFLTVIFILELDAFDFWCTLIRSLVILSIVARLAYRRPLLQRVRRDVLPT
jgi:hypothetical protein